MGEHVINGIANAKKCQVRGLGQDIGFMWQGQGSKPERQWLQRPQEPRKCHSGHGWCLQDEAMGNPTCFPIFGLGFENSFSYMVNLILLTSVSNDFEIRTQKGQRKRHPAMDDHLQCWGQIH